jgi:HNH endonuclease
MEEIWKDAPGVEHRIQVSNCGNLKSKEVTKHCRRKNGTPYLWKVPGKPITPWVGNNGYLHISVKDGEKRPKYLVHRLIAFAFVEGYQSGYSVNHINCNKLDNRADNLEWVTLADNTRMQWRDGLVDLRGEKQPGSKLTAKQVIYIRRLLAQGIASHTLAIIAGVSPTTITMIRDGKRWKHLIDGESL